MYSTCNTYKVKYAGICGSDINKAKDVGFQVDDILKLGHEIVCLSNKGDLFVVNPFFCNSNCPVCEQGSYFHCEKVTRLGAGVVKGGFSGMICADPDNLYKIPQCSHPEIGVLCDGIAVVFHGFHMIQLQNIQRLAIIGAGSIGILAAMVAKKEYPNLRVDIFFKSTRKKNFLIKQFGDFFNYVDISEISSKSNCYDIVMEAVGGRQTETINHSIEIVKNSGSILVFGAFSEESNHLKRFRQLFYKQITIIGVNSFCKKCNDFQKAVNWTFANEELLFPLLTDLYVIDRGRIEEKDIYRRILDQKILKGYFVYE